MLKADAFSVGFPTKSNILEQMLASFSSSSKEKTCFPSYRILLCLSQSLMFCQVKQPAWTLLLSFSSQPEVAVFVLCNSHRIHSRQQQRWVTLHSVGTLGQRGFRDFDRKIREMWISSSKIKYDVLPRAILA